MTARGASTEARRAADALGSPLAEFSGDHGGFLDPSLGFGGEPEAFARVLRQILTEAG